MNQKRDRKCEHAWTWATLTLIGSEYHGGKSSTQDYFDKYIHMYLFIYQYEQ